VKTAWQERRAGRREGRQDGAHPLPAYPETVGGDDDFAQYVLTDGSRAFTGIVNLDNHANLAASGIRFRHWGVNAARILLQEVSAGSNTYHLNLIDANVTRFRIVQDNYMLFYSSDGLTDTVYIHDTALECRNVTLDMNGNNIVLNAGSTVFIVEGTGSPEGVVTAGIGSTFHRTDGGAGTSFYVKETGTGNTGWVGK